MIDGNKIRCRVKSVYTPMCQRVLWQPSLCHYMPRSRKRSQMLLLLISPTKTLDFSEEKDAKPPGTQPEMTSLINGVAASMKTQSLAGLKKILNVSDNLSRLNHVWRCQISALFPLSSSLSLSFLCKTLYPFFLTFPCVLVHDLYPSEYNQSREW